MFYADDGWIAGRDRIWVQDDLTETVATLRRVGLETNLEKTSSQVYTPGYIWGKYVKAVYKRRATM